MNCSLRRSRAWSAPQGAIVKSPDRVKDYYSKNKRGRGVDASIRYKVGTIDILITIECRARSRSQDETWIEQLATKKTAIRASRTVAVSSRGFSEAAHEKARMFDIELRTISEVTADDISKWVDVNCIFTNNRQVNFMKFHWQLQCEDVSGIDVAEKVKQEQQEKNVHAKFIRFGESMMSVVDFIQTCQHRFKGTEKDLFYGVELVGPPVPKQVYFTFADDSPRVETNKGELPLRSMLIEVEVVEQTIRVPPARIYRYADEKNQLRRALTSFSPIALP